MSDFKNVMKSGWHPKGKEGGKESWRGDFKGINQVAGWMGKGKTAESTESSHVSRPLASLKDPSSFGPPPKNVNYHGGAALPNEITPQTSGWGAPLSRDQITSARAATATPPAQEAELSQKSAPPPLPFRADSTGLRTDNLPPPPKHRDLNTTTATSLPQQTSRPMPGLPPRVPSRQNTVEPPPPSYESSTSATTVKKTSTPTLNRAAMNRLGNAGVSVPALGIGKSNNNNASTVPNTSEGNPWKSEKSQTSSPGLSELQSRFSRMTTSNDKSNVNATTSASPAATTPVTTSPQPESQPQAPTWQQTRSALTTANSAYKDPTSVTLADAQSAAQTAQNAQKSANAFRERHNETISAAQTRASQLNKRYNMTGRLNKFLEDANNAHDQQQTQQQPLQSPPIPQHPNQQQQQQQFPSVSSPPSQQQGSAVPELAASISRKPPPPPPPKKPASMQAPPPVPLGTKPNFG